MLVPTITRACTTVEFERLPLGFQLPHGFFSVDSLVLTGEFLLNQAAALRAD